MGKIRKLLHNIKYLSQKNIEEIYWESIQNEKIAIRYGGLLQESINDNLHILNSEDSLQQILSKPKSFYRFGDGEIEIMLGGNAGTQMYNPKLSKGLMDAFLDIDADAYIGIGYDYFNFNIWNGNDFQNKFYLFSSEKYRNFYLKYCEKNYTYIDTGFTQRYFTLPIEKRIEWFADLKALFKEKNVVLFMGEQAYKNLNYYIFDEANEVNVNFCPSKNAYDKYDDIVEKVRGYSKDTLICMAIGATSKVLAYQLTKEGYLVYDIGHMLKDYDSYKKEIIVNHENAEMFYKEDYKLL